VDRVLRIRRHTIHEITPSYSKEHEISVLCEARLIGNCVLSIRHGWAKRFLFANGSQSLCEEEISRIPFTFLRIRMSKIDRAFEEGTVIAICLAGALLFSMITIATLVVPLSRWLKVKGRFIVLVKFRT
jgi:hypothetical protein